MSITTAGWPDRLVTLAEWEALPEDELHDVECSEGILIVAPKPFPLHQRVARRLAGRIEEQLPAKLTVETDCDVELAEVPLTVRAPDVLVVDATAFAANPPRFDPGDVYLAVEILSPGSIKTDRILKPTEYAEVGIPAYWIVDLAEPITCTTHVLSDRALEYRAGGSHSGAARLEVAGSPLRLDFDRLADYRLHRAP